MEKNNKLKAKLLMFSILSAFYPGVFADDDTAIEPNDEAETAVIKRAVNLDEQIHYATKDNPDALLPEKFVKRHLQGTRLEKGKITVGEKIGEGGFGTVSEANQNGDKLVIKRPKQGQSKQEQSDNAMLIDDEFYNGLGMVRGVDLHVLKLENLEKNLKESQKSKKLEKFQKSKTRNIFGKLSGFRAVIMPAGQMKDGGIVQEHANGLDMFDSPQSATRDWLTNQILTAVGTHLGNTIDSMIQSGQKNPLAPSIAQKLVRTINAALEKSRCDFFDSRGFPRNPQQAIESLCSFFHALVALHEIGHVHCDIKSENVILTRDNVLKLIDLGGLAQTGQEICTWSGNGAPETLYPEALGLPSAVTAHPAYDIYCSLDVILGILFGLQGYYTSHHYFWPYTETVRQDDGEEKQISRAPFYIQCVTEYEQFRQKDDEERRGFFDTVIDPLNEQMGQPGPNGEVHKNYPPYVLKEIKALLRGISAPYPKDRPSAVEILEKLQDLALSDWNDTIRPEEERYRINRHPKLPEISEENKPINWDADWLEEYPVAKPTQR